MRSSYPAGTPSWVDTWQPDPDAAAAFYGGLFGWTFVERMPADGPGQYMVALLEDHDVAAVGSLPGPASPPAWNTYVTVDSVDDAVDRIRDAGGSVLVDPFDVLDAGRTAVATDPAGALFCLWQAGRHHGSELVNQPDTWNWSNLATRDPEGAKAFYGAVFGWEARPVELGEYKATMWCLPGYGDFLVTLEPGLRERQSDEGVPEGFADAIGWMETMTDDQHAADTPAHWAVTFSVADTTATAAKAAELGGTVLVPPFDAGSAMVATLADPAGAVFTISTYTPEA